MNGPTTSLAQLRDIHMPTLIAWWPLAIGWWVVAGLILLILVSVIYYNWRRQQQKPLRHVLAMLAKLQQQQNRTTQYELFAGTINHHASHCISAFSAN